MAPDGAFHIDVSNSYGPGSARSYSVFSEAPQVTGGSFQQSDIIRLVSEVVGPIENGGHKNFTYKLQYFAFIGRKVENNGRVIINPEMELPGVLGTNLDNGTIFDACVSNSGALSLQTSQARGSPQGSFTVRCIDPVPAPHDIVVGLAQVFNDILQPVAAVPYAHGVPYTIKPRGPIYLVREDMAVRQAIPPAVLVSGQAVTFQGSQVYAKATEGSVGQITITMVRFGPSVPR